MWKQLTNPQYSSNNRHIIKETWIANMISGNKVTIKLKLAIRAKHMHLLSKYYWQPSHSPWGQTDELLQPPPFSNRLVQIATNTSGMQCTLQYTPYFRSVNVTDVCISFFYRFFCAKCAKLKHNLEIRLSFDMFYLLNYSNLLSPKCNKKLSVLGQKEEQGHSET
jgi:hypothetical protein